MNSIVLPIIIVLLFIYIYYNVRATNVENIKGREEKKEIYVFIIIAKLIMFILIAVRISAIVAASREMFALNQENIQAANKIADYYTLPIVAGNVNIDDSNQMDYNHKLDMFYAEGKNLFEMIVIDTRNYVSLDYEGEGSIAYQYDQDWIVVNEKYLEINPIYDQRGNVIDTDSFQPNCLNILIPCGMDPERVIREQYPYFSSIGVEFNVIFYGENQIIRSFNPYVGMNNNGMIENPIIEIYNSEIRYGQMLNYVSGGYLMVHLEGDEPYEELRPLLEKYDLENIIVKTERISNVYDNSIKSIARLVKKEIMELLAYIVAAFFVVYYSCYEFFYTNKEEIVTKLIKGYSILMILTIPIALAGIQLLVGIFLSVFVRINLLVILVMTILEIVIIAIDMIFLIKSNLPLLQRS